MTPTFTVLIGSLGRSTLRQTLDSIARQHRVTGDQVIVALDSFEHGEQPDVQQLVTGYGPGFDVCAYDSGYHWLGVEQINYAMHHVPMTGTHVFTLGDDDVFTDDAYATLRPVCAADPAQPVLYRFVAPWRELLWDHPRLEMSRISGCCIAAPAAFVGPMTTAKIVEHDYWWMKDILARSGREPRWLDRVLVIARPDIRHNRPLTRGVLQCWHCKGWRWLEDVNWLDAHCPHCGVVLDLPGREPAHAVSA